ncbi:MAG: tyrosine-type recombinase/integrase [Streptosporangiaceae bacterium]
MSGRQGSLKRDPESGTWSFVVDLTSPGVRPRKQVRRRGYPTKKAALAGLDEIKDELSRGEYVAPTKQTLGGYLTDTWLPTVRGRYRPTTVDTWTRLARVHVIGHTAADIPLQQLTAPALDRLYADLAAGARRGPLSAASVRMVHTLVHRALADAVRWNLLARNAADRASRPRVERPEPKAWSPETLRAFLAATASDRYAPLWRFLASTGCRRSEALGLRWRDVDLDARTASIVRILVPVGGAITFDEPKTATGRRTVALDTATVRTLRDHRRRQAAERLMIGEGWRGEAYGDLVFTAPDGSPILPQTATQAFRLAVRRYGLPSLPLHGLRHTWATNALRAGVHPKVVQGRLGHSSIAMTLDVYSHVTEGMDAAAAETVAALIAGGDGAS